MRLRPLLYCAVVVCNGCGVTPWIKPYEHDLLADPLMTFSRHETLDRTRTHVFEVREGTRGAAIGSGGGCGCN